MAIFNSYVKLPEGQMVLIGSSPGPSWMRWPRWTDHQSCRRRLVTPLKIHHGTPRKKSWIESGRKCRCSCRTKTLKIPIINCETLVDLKNHADFFLATQNPESICLDHPKVYYIVSQCLCQSIVYIPRKINRSPIWVYLKMWYTPPQTVI